ncbi:MAG: type II secretion system protein [Sedimentisphaeraceae bacterium JB056]
MKKKAFTLIELLVVISIIALLMAIMMPALSKAKEQANKMVCSSRMRSVSVGPFLFANDNNGWFPMTDGTTFGDINAGDGCQECVNMGSVYPQRDLWYIDIAPYLGLTEDPYVKQSWMQAETKGLDAPKIYQCASMKKTYYGTKGLAFGWNWNGMGYKCKDYFDPKAKNYWLPRKPSQITSAAVTGIIGENPLGQDPELEKNAPRHYWGGQVWEQYTGGKYGFYFYGDRHSGGSSYICVDGHVEYRKIDEYIEDYERQRGNIGAGSGIIFPGPRRW